MLPKIKGEFLTNSTKSLKKFMWSLWGILSGLVAGIISSWLYEFLKTFPQSSWNKAIQNILNFKISLIHIIILFGLLIIPFLFFTLTVSQERKSKQINRLEKDLTSFVFDVLESHLDQELIKLITKTIEEADKNHNLLHPYPLLPYLLTNIKEYLKFLPLSGISIFMPEEENNEYLTVSYAKPPLSKTVIQSLRCYIGKDTGGIITQRNCCGLAGLAFITGQIQKMIFKIDDITNKPQAFLIKNDSSGQILFDKFSDYIDLREETLFYLRATIAVPLFKTRLDKKGEKLTEIQDILGVACFDVNTEELFQSEQCKTKITEAAKCLSITIEVQKLFEDLKR